MSTGTAKLVRGHVLVVSLAADSIPEEPAYDFTVECLAPSLCGGWQECTGDHLIGHAEPNPEDDEDCSDELEFHGVEHAWRPGYGWTVPFPGCIVADRVGQWDSGEWEIASEHGPGRHAVEDDWDDSELTLYFIETLEEA